MTNAELIAGYAGPLLAAIAVSVLVNRRTFDAIMGQAGENVAFIFFAGILTLLAGLAIVRAHNAWIWGWEVIVTIIGWLAVIGGLLRIIVPDRVAAVRARLTKNETFLSAWALVVLALGLFLTAKGYGLAV
jgi:hypothetical protein